MSKSSKSIKLVLDIVIGAVAPVAILKYGTALIGTLPAYLLAALVPVVWVLLDLLVITRRFNFISSYSGFSAIMRGALAFWYVSGALFALKDTASYILAVFVFAGSAFFAKPITRAIAFQGLGPDTPEREASLDRLLDQPTVTRSLRISALVIGATNGLCGLVNYILNLRIVVAPFNTPAFNDQVANVNAITRVVLVVPDMLALFWAFSMMYKAMYALLPPENGPGPDGGEFWTLLGRYEAGEGAAPTHASARTDPMAATASMSDDSSRQTRANRHARDEFGV